VGTPTERLRALTYAPRVADAISRLGAVDVIHDHSGPPATTALEALVYQALRRRPAERYASMAALAHDLADLDAVVMPDKYELDLPPPAPLGDLPPWRTTLPILAIILGVSLALGVVAELLHRNMAPH